MVRLVLFFVIMAVVLTGCMDKSDIPIPAYLFIPSIALSTTPEQGSISNAFRDVWIYVNDTFAGAYELPVKVPVAQFGTAQIKVYAGIRNNGVLSQPSRYSMTSPYVVEAFLEAAKVDTIIPVVGYYPNCIFPFVENFDLGHFFSRDIDGNPQTQISLTAKMDAFEGANSGEILLTKDNPIMITSYAISKPIPIGPNKVYIELDYKTDIAFSIGFEGMKAGETKNLINGNLRPKASWNKIYFDFTESIVQNACDNYRVAVFAVYDTSNAMEKQYIRIDNFKVIHQ